MRFLPRFAILASLASGCYWPTDDSIPETDSCLNAPSGDYTNTSLGRVVDGEFVPLEDGAILDVTWGGQGTPMIALAFRVEGSEVDCIAQETVIEHAGISTGSNVPLRAYASGENLVATEAHYLPIGVFDSDIDVPYTIRSTIGQETHEFWVWRNRAYEGPSIAGVTPNYTEPPSEFSPGRSLSIEPDGIAPDVVRMAATVDDESVVSLDSTRIRVQPGTNFGTLRFSRVAAGKTTVHLSLGTQTVDYELEFE